MIEVAERIAREAGELLLDYRRRIGELDIDRKGAIDLVTQADVESEKLVRRRLAESFPDHAIHGEELGRSGPDDSEHVWIVDPLDGTTNFVHSHPMFTVSMGLMREGQPYLGVVHAPVLGETFTAVRGEGAKLNGQPIRVSGGRELGSAMLATGFPYKRAEIPDNNVDNFAHMVVRVRGIRRGGAASLDLAYVACGRFDAYWELHLSAWDVAAGACIVREAGGRVTDFAEGEDWLFGGNILASNVHLHAPLRAELEAVAAR